MSDPRGTVDMLSMGNGENMEKNEKQLMRKVDIHLKKVWPLVMEDWKNGMVTPESENHAIALVTRDCAECDTRVRVGAVISPLSPKRPPGNRAYCATCKKVTISPIREIRGLLVVDDEDTGD